MNNYTSKKDRIEIMVMKIKLNIQKFMKTKFGAYLWQIVSSILILAIAGGIGVFAAFAKTEGSSMTYAKTYFKYFMTHSWSLMYGETDLDTSKYINETSFGEMMSNIVPNRGSDKYKFVDRGTDGTYNIIDVVYQETGSDVKQTMTLKLKKKEEKELLILNQWEVCLSSEILRDCTVTAPAGMNLALDGISLSDAEYTDDPDTGLRTYTLGQVLAGKHRLEISGVQTKSVYESFIWESSRSGYTVQAETLDPDQLRKEQQLLLDYARLAVTEENVALLAQQALAARPQVEASTLAEEYPGDFARIIGLHTYSQSPHRNYDIRLTGNWVERGGFRFEDFVLTRRKEENDGND